MRLAWLAVVAATFALGAPAAAAASQEPAPAPAVEDLSSLSLDELIERLPRVGWDLGGPPGERSLVPVARELRDRIERGVELDAQQWRRALLATGAVRLRERWPAGEPFALSMRAPAWLPRTSIRLVSREAGLAPAEAGFLHGGGSCGTYASQIERRWRYQELGELCPGPQRIAFELTLVRGGPPYAGPARDGAQVAGGLELSELSELFCGELAFDVECVAELDLAVPPCSSAEIDAAVRAGIGVAFHRNEGDGERYAVAILDPDVEGALAGVGLSLELDALRDGVVQETATLFAAAYEEPVRRATVHATGEQPFACVALRSVPSAAAADAAERARWSLRARGTGRGVLRLWYATRRWDGRVELSLDEALRREREVAPRGRGPLWSTPDAFASHER